MTQYLGRDGLSGRMTGQVPGLSSDLNAGSWSYPAGISGLMSGLPPRAGLDADGRWQHVPAFAHWGEVGHAAIVNPLWDQIIIQPTTRDFGVVLSDVNFTIEVWSTHLRRSQVMASISISGPGNLVVTDSWGVPITYWPGQSRSYPAVLPGSGDPTIASSATFNFGLTAAAFTATGMRVAVFWPACDWSEPFRERPQWKTTILNGRRGGEQRIQLRTLPRHQASFRIVTMDEVLTAALDAQIHHHQPLLWGVPWWPEASNLLMAVAAGDSILHMETSDRPSFYGGGLALLWRDPAHWEAASIQLVTDGEIDLAMPISASWPTGTRVVPMRRGYLGDQEIGRPTNWVSAGEFTFVCEAAP